MLAALLKRGCQVNAPTNDGWTALHEAAANGHALIVDKLLASGAQASLPRHVPVMQMHCNKSLCPAVCIFTVCKQLHSIFPAVVNLLAHISKP